MKVMKRCAAIFILIGILFIGVKIYLTQFASSPAGVVESFFDAYNHSDINGMVSCMEPGTEQMVSGATDLAGSLLGVLTGFDLDFGALVDIMPFFSDTGFDHTPQIPISDVRVISYTSAFSPELTDLLVNFMLEFINVIADTAVVSFQVEGTELQVDVINYGADGWRIPLDSALFA